MRTCCFCIPILPGATVIGVLGILVALGMMAPLTTYLMEFEEFDPIRQALPNILFQLDKSLSSEFDMQQEDIEAINEAVEENTWYVVLVLEAMAGFYALFALSMIIGILGDMRGLMIPYLMYQMLLTVVAVLVLLGVTIAFFYYKILIGIVSVAVLLIVSFELVYYWVAVQKAYVELGSRDYMYSPAPTKSGGGYNGSSHHYPSAPQRFEMQEQAM